MNENVDANIYGLEGEFIFSPVDDFLIDVNVRVPEDRDQGLHEHRSARSEQRRSELDDDQGHLGRIELRAGDAQRCRRRAAFGLVLPAALGGPFGFCGALAANGFSVQDGVAADLDGNQLQSAPELSFKVGAQYTFGIGAV